jgi:hypothetical protein
VKTFANLHKLCRLLANRAISEQRKSDKDRHPETGGCNRGMYLNTDVNVVNFGDMGLPLTQHERHIALTGVGI